MFVAESEVKPEAFKKLGFDLTLILLYLDISMSGLIEVEVKVEAVQLL